ncbi:type I restriction enzyme, S subunit [Halanaerobium congolense]|uniref:Type I restriction enzyme, S subunit n=1 Tax=Halanaerobium congolense TaxID=54121 RepID=A0A1I0CK80_9FIRM|nr:restriction endonuclease subunit S [Halanaerobium congolense]PTX14863.1 type I restriction enzyme S subunit [Halanaerobium congolense]SDG01874.1 type I restriction enzyme, S subunit [Halanaerobium congolense]SET19857.1 type I restriction enzyme, S subunit [Halanaerobium congolense]SFP66973.1 type I restriction enzyme, S subunit [Halanaerobium congolense]
MSFNEDWKEYKLENLIKMQKGFAFKSKDYQEDGVKIVKVSNFTDDSIDINSCTHISENKKNKYKKYILENNDILISTVGSWPSNPKSVVGKVIRVPIEAKGSLLNQNIVRLKSKPEKLSQLFLYYILRNKDFKNYIISGARGSANQASITLKSIRNYKFRLPSLREQEEIADIFFAIDKKIENNNKMNKTLEEMAQVIYKNWFVDFEPFQEEEFVESELGMIPEGWKVGYIDEFINITYGKNLAKKNMSGSGYKVFSASGLVGYHKEFLYKEPQVLMTCRGSGCGDIYESTPKSFVTNNCLVFEADEDTKINRFYLKQFLLNSNRDQFITGSAQPQITITNISKMKMLVPDQKTLDKFTKIIKKLNNKININKRENQTLKKLRDSLLPKLMSGEIRVPLDKDEKEVN